LPRKYPDAPVVGVGAVVVKDDRVLLVRRANEPSRGRWSIPGGTVELGETLAQAAAREVREECQVEVDVGPLLSTFDLIQRDAQGQIRYHYLLLDLAARHVRGEPVAGTDALEVRWVAEDELASLDLVPRLLPVLRQALQTPWEGD
jgi:ADP-ribose pyrophosphatase